MLDREGTNREHSSFLLLFVKFKNILKNYFKVLRMCPGARICAHTRRLEATVAPGLELEAFVSCPTWELRTKSGQESFVLNHRAVSPTHYIFFGIR